MDGEQLVQVNDTLDGVVDTADHTGSPGESLCRVLVEAGYLGKEDAARALKLRLEQAGDENLGSLLVNLGFVSDSHVAEALSQLLNIPLVRKSEFPQDQFPTDEKVSLKFLQENKSLVLAEEQDQVIVVMADPDNRTVIDAIKHATGKRVVPRIGIASEIEQALQQRIGIEKERLDESDDSNLNTLFLDDVARLKEIASEAPVIKLVNQLIQNAVEAGASDIHIEPFENHLIVRYRVDGILREIESPPVQIAAAIVSRIKIMANLNIAERRLPQDGRFKLRVKGGMVDLRISTIPTMDGESVVMRLLHRDGGKLEFSSLGFSEENKTRLLELLDKPHGILLVTGPTGSGKTTTLYTALKYLNRPERKILTVEDPVEYKFDGINQIQTKPQIGLTFANALRSIVRQDPDVIMIGEMRDQETAKIAVQSALTGHLVLSTIHTNDAAGTITRLLDMGVDDYLLTSTVEAILAQRLVRKLCSDCKQAYSPLPDVVKKWRLDRWSGGDDVTLYKPVGCEKCSGTGYEGRHAIVELMVLDDSIRQSILEHADSEAIAAKAVSAGFETMFEDGLGKVVAGVTTLEEVLRVTQEN